MRRCDFCNTTLRADACPSCELYNAAVDAQRAAANRIARDYHPNAKDAWLNRYGVFAWIDGVTRQVGTPEQAAPFDALTGAARKVTGFYPNDGAPTDLTCAFCRAPAEGNYSVHRDGFGEGPEVDLCDACGADPEPTLETIWARIRVAPRLVLVSDPLAKESP